MPESYHREIGLLRWEELVERLQTREWMHNPRFVRGLEDYFGPDQVSRLRWLVRRVEWRRRRRLVDGNVVFVHGTLCANLTTTHANGFEDMLWLNLLRLAIGRLDLLKLAPDGLTDANAALPVHVEGLLKYTYAVPLLWLHARWNVRPFAYDWRKSLDVAADELGELIRSRFPGQPVHLVAHSMGGLVCRNFIRRHPDLWAEMRDAEMRRGGRLVMLGTPNYGSFLATQALSGESALVWGMNAADLAHDIRELLDITNSFVSFYEMMPSPSKLPAETQAIYTRETWGPLPISETHLERARSFWAQLEADPATADPERLRYIAAYGVRTAEGLNVIRPGVFNHAFTHRGDGVVTLDLGPLPGVPTWYIAGDHFTMAWRARVLVAVEQLLRRGETAVLTRKPVPARGLDAPVVDWMRAAGDGLLEQQLRDIARRAQADEATGAEVHAAERTLIARSLGDRRTERHLIELARARVRSVLERWMPDPPSRS